MAENVLGKIILDAGNQARGITGGGAPPVTGLLGDAPGGDGTSGNEAKTNRFQKGIEGFQKKSLEFAAAQPRWFTSMFKKMGIQMGLAGILKQSQIFTSTVGALFQIFGAFVDVLIAPLIRPLILPVLRWLARQIPVVGRASKAFFAFISKAGTGFINFVKKFVSGDFWTNTVFKGLIDFFTETFPERLKEAFDIVKDIGANIWGWLESGMRTAWNSTLGNTTVPWINWTIPPWGGGSAGTTHFREKPTPPGAGKDNTTMLEAYDKDGNLIAVEDLTTIEGRHKPNEKVRKWLEEQGADPVPFDPAKGHINVPGGKPAGEDDKDDRSWWQKIFDPQKWKDVFGDFKEQFKDFWSGGAIENVLKGVGVTVGGSLAYTTSAKMVRGLGQSVKGVTWPLAKLIQLMNAAAKTPGMMGLNTAKWALRQMNVFDPTTVARTLTSEGFTKGGADLARRGLKTMGSGVSNAFLDAVRTGFDPFAKGWQATKNTVNWMTPGRESVGLFNTSKAVTEVDIGRVQMPETTAPRARSIINPEDFKKRTPVIDIPTGSTPIDTKQSLARRATAKFQKFSDSFSAFIRGARSWTVDNILEKGARIASLGDEAFQAAKSAGMGDIMGRITMLKSFIGRLVPVAASGIAIATTGKNIADIANMEHLSWWLPHKGLMEEELNPIIAQMTKDYEKSQKGGAWDAALGGIGLSAQGKTLTAKSMEAWLSGTKGGAVAMQSVLGGTDALLGFGGALTLPLQAGVMGVQYGHMESVKNWNQKTGEYTGTLDQLLSDAGTNMDAATIQLAIEQGMSKALERAKVQNVMSTNHMADIGMIGIP